MFSATSRDVFEHIGMPDALLPLSIGPVVVEVAQLTHERAFPDSWSTNDCNAHGCLNYME